MNKVKCLTNQPRLRNIAWFIMILLGVTTPVLSGMSNSNFHTKEQNFHAQGLEVDSFTGRLRIEVAARSDLAVRLSGAVEDIDGIALSVRNGTLHIDDQRGASGSSTTSVVTMGNVTTVVSGGGTASVSIGGREIGSGVNHPTMEISVSIPTGVPINLRAMNGDCHIGNTHGPVDLTLSSGNCVLGEITKGELLVQGSGNIEVRQVHGDLRVGINGSGDVRVRNGQVNRLEATLDGSGQIDLGVQAQEAVLSLMGAGNIRVTEVRVRPRVTVMGAGEVDVGNW
ncbi:putative DUF2807 domain-containing protein [Gammaproteobacteria bacterium]